MYGCVEDRPVLDVLHYDFELKTWNKIKEYSTPCSNHPWYDRELGHTIAVYGPDIYLACTETGVEGMYKISTMRESSFKDTTLSKVKDPASLQIWSFKVNQNSGFIDRFDLSGKSLTRYEEIGDSFEQKLEIRWRRIRVIDAILHNNLFFAVCFEHKRVIKVVLDQNE